MQTAQARVIRHETFSGDYRILVLHAPDIAAAVKPGQFVHLRVPNLDGAVLRRPFSVFEAHASNFSILYKTVGRGTTAMCAMRPDGEVDVVGPLGNGFPICEDGRMPVLVAGGYGVAPLYLLATRLESHGLVFIGGKSARDVLCQTQFEARGWQVRVTTEDGSQGCKGRVTDSLDPWLAGRNPDMVFYACGPDGMLRAVGERAIAAGRQAWLSLDKHMGCGVGACLACVQKIRAPDGVVAWKRVCRDGPVFESREIVWER
jgi:dihydroorotate dehydrogenase electron transfer subunit